jgi:hypothetical protein
MNPKLVRESLNETKWEDTFDHDEWREYHFLSYPSGNLSARGEQRLEKLKKKYGFINVYSGSKRPEQQFTERKNKRK